jgi:uncharacterized phiE125 gp8 family phage protein
LRLADLIVVTPAAAPVVTVEEFTDHARLNGITVGAEPDLVSREIDAATSRAEQYLRRSLIEQTLKALFVPESNGDPACALPRGPVASVTEILSNGAAITGFTLAWNIVTLNAAAPGPVEIEYVSAGFGAAGADVPEPVREGILEYATALYEDRMGARPAKYAGAVAKLPPGIADLWRPFQIELGG